MNKTLHEDRRSLNVVAGILAAMRWGAFGALAAAAVVAMLELNSSYFDSAIAPILGCGAVLACAGWVAHAPRPSHSIAASLSMVFAGSILIWILISFAEITPRRQRKVEHPAIYLSEALVLLASPVLMATVLTVMWSTGISEPSKRSS